MFKNAPWKGWKTRKISFSGVCLVWLVYSILGMFKVEIDTMILDFIYKAGTWILGFGTALVTADKMAELMLKVKSKEKEEE